MKLLIVMLQLSVKEIEKENIHWVSKFDDRIFVWFSSKSEIRKKLDCGTPLRDATENAYVF